MAKRQLAKTLSVSIAALFIGLYASVRLAAIMLPPPSLDGVEYSTTVLDRHGELLRLYTTSEGFWRLPVELAAVDSDFQQLLLAYEDRRFYEHGGVDGLSLTRAFWQWLKHGRVVSGGSTITMQLARLLQPQPRTLKAKFVEFFRAWQLESHYSKAQILTRYLELAPYGGNLQGVVAASRFYFGKRPEFLTLSEKALLIALPQSPESRRPDINHHNARQARNHVLRVLHKNDYLSQRDLDRALLQTLPNKRRATPFIAPHLSDRLRLANSGVSILQTSLDLKLQQQIERLIGRYQYSLPEGVTIAAMVIDNESAQARAYVGSGDYFATTFPGQVDMLQAIRSPGSTLKPFIYGLGLEANLIHPQTLISDHDESVQGYRPANFDGIYQGEMTIHDALVKSRNIPAIKVLNRVGATTLQNRFDEAGVKLHLPANTDKPGLPIALGGVGIRFEDLVALYAAIPRAGQYKAIAYEKAYRPDDCCSLISKQAAWYLTDILADALSPAGYLTTQQRQIAFKTGTSYGFHDAWSIGFNARYTIAIWIGRPDGGFTQGLYGLQNATPIMLDAFDLLPRNSVAHLLKDKPENIQVVERADLPEHLQTFEAPLSRLIKPVAFNRLKVLYPPKHSELKLANDKSLLLQIKASGGQSPYTWLNNGRVVGSQTEKPMLNWVVQRSGKFRISVIDAEGRSDSTEFFVR